MYKVGDVVRVIATSYINIDKSGLMQRNCWAEADQTRDKHVMLGGRYSVLEVSVTCTGCFYKLVEPRPNDDPFAFLPPINWSEFLVLDRDVENCPYKVGDKVLFRPKCSVIDVKYLTMIEAWSLEDPDTVHEVRGIINNYYIVIDYEVGHIYSHPLRWVDFEPA